MIVIPNTTRLFRLPKKTPKLLQIHLPSGITSILNVYLRQIWSKLKIFCNFYIDQPNILYLEHCDEGSRVALNVHIYSRFIVHLATIYVSHSILK